MRKTTRIAVGAAMVGIGAVGLILPVIPGLLFLLGGGLWLSADLPAVGRLICRIEQYNPELGAKLKRIRTRLQPDETFQCPPEKPASKT
jgi:hypothetical protein